MGAIWAGPQEVPFYPFLGEGSPTKMTTKNGYSYSSQSTGGPRFGQHSLLEYFPADELGTRKAIMLFEESRLRVPYSILIWEFFCVFRKRLEAKWLQGASAVFSGLGVLLTRVGKQGDPHKNVVLLFPEAESQRASPGN